jgi:hypothetical protein
LKEELAVVHQWVVCEIIKVPNGFYLTAEGARELQSRASKPSNFTIQRRQQVRRSIVKIVSFVLHEMSCV